MRLQLDNGLRTFGLMMAEKAHATAQQMLAGKRLDKLKDRDGKPLRDSHIASTLDGLHPGVWGVYDLFSGHVHLSQQAFYRAWDVPDSPTPGTTAQIRVGDPAGFVSDVEWANLKSAFEFATEVALQLIQAWAFMGKNLPPGGPPHAAA